LRETRKNRALIRTLPGGANSWATGINNRGQIVGYAETAGGQTHAFLYANGVMRDLGTFPGGTDSWAYSINNCGQIVGEATTAAGFKHAFLYNPWNPAAISCLLD
jgi:probable HAF family extracellular repeat protein